jgi:hypothetical protein
MTFARIIAAQRKLQTDLTKLERYIAQSELDEAVKLFVRALGDKERVS